MIKPDTISIERNRFQQKLANPIFAFAMQLVTGRVKGLENYKVDAPITYSYDIKSTDFPINDAV